MAWLDLNPADIRHILITQIDDKYLFTGDTIWFGPDGGYSFLSSLAEDNKLAVKSLAVLEEKLRRRGLNPMVITGHTGWHDGHALFFKLAVRLN